jgi:hypothetical protein
MHPQRRRVFYRTGNWNCEWPSTHTMTGIPGGTVIAPESTANFLARCARAHDRFFYPCNAKHREPQSCTYVFRSSGVAEVFEVRVAECTYCEGGTGWRVWPCALLLSCWLAAERRELQLPTLRVLELGCGLGLPGLTAAALGAAESVLSDCLPILLRTVAESVRCVHVGAGDTRTGSRRTRVALLDWDEEAPGCADAASRLRVGRGAGRHGGDAAGCGRWRPAARPSAPRGRRRPGRSRRRRARSPAGRCRAPCRGGWRQSSVHRRDRRSGWWRGPGASPRRRPRPARCQLCVSERRISVRAGSVRLDWRVGGGSSSGGRPRRPRPRRARTDAPPALELPGNIAAVSGLSSP